jgi:hypothetical protein
MTVSAMAEARLLMFHRRSEAERWQKVLDAAGLKAQCETYEEPYLDERYGWQPPMWKWFEFEIEGEMKEVFVIDGSWERTNRLIDISEGGNHHAYPDAIPPNRIYVEAVNDESQYDPRLVGERHEGKEDYLMGSDPDIVYEEAHGFATHDERIERREHRDWRVESKPGKRGE